MANDKPQRGFTDRIRDLLDALREALSPRPQPAPVPVPARDDLRWRRR